MEELTVAKKDYEKALEEGVAGSVNCSLQNVNRLNDILDHLMTVSVTLPMLKVRFPSLFLIYSKREWWLV